MSIACGVDQRHVHMFEVFSRGIVDCRRRIGAAWLAQDEESGGQIRRFISV
jgi:hypothetical protein